ncbi:hypothetical protein [Rhizobium leguminosarum]|uniref:hypothetical protein n=1 Tax=Rhizobium leguminosarum TaxID=384 RepID=UPI001C97C65A|nr:hypothetical protein [Rhizobium leguminosarum]MBY5736963.1 hypothetical protein [Rhizobium leguminosarum]
MRTTVQKGKSAGGIAYGYRVKQAYDERGDRIPALREIDEAEARIIRWISAGLAPGNWQPPSNFSSISRPIRASSP